MNGDNSPKIDHMNIVDSNNLIPNSSSYQESKSINGNNDGDDVNVKRENTKQQRKRKKKVEIACVYCRRSHMICDDSRPCQRCIKRGIGHLCYDEPSNSRQRKKAAALKQHGGVGSPPAYPSEGLLTNSEGENISDEMRGKDQRMMPAMSQVTQQKPNGSVLSQTLPYNQEPFFYSEHAGSEFSSLNDFLSMIDDPELVNGALNDDSSQADVMLNFGFSQNNGSGNGVSNVSLVGDSGKGANVSNMLSFSPQANIFPQSFPNETEIAQLPTRLPSQKNHFNNNSYKTENLNLNLNVGSNALSRPVISDSARDKFFLTAADPTTEISPEERLKQVIKAKLEAGLLQPYNYAKGYARLQSYMDNYMNLSSRQRILKPLSIFRPAFRAIARTLKDVDLVLVEESFERMLLDYDRVFTSMAIPACLWRRTGEIYRGNKEFASLVGVITDDLKDGKLAIYELMSEESAVNFWEKYGAIAFDKGQKAVLTSCNLRTKDGTKRKSCCFSFTIRRDRYNIPSCIVGNFIPIDPS
ncbi:uncharacterized protein PRCAT00000451001 [Priceomyces carsonii]|uniref:uncharacterized protein n=1 Tax=Priceomyces carsonii TaxID=28549 RepID=UPI002EDA12C4|nr:unnamed protein product [Priceomyces carsonii]